MRNYLQRCCLSVITALLLAMPCYASQDFAQRPDVQAFISDMIKKYKFNKQKLTRLFTEVKVRPQIIANLNAPLEKKSWNYYQHLFVSSWRIQNGVKFWNKHASALNKAEQIYGVPASIIVATIGIETRYGERTGDFRVIDSLSNIAFSNSPRAKFFRSELAEFLLLTREEHLNPLKIMGSYAGAIGQPQFMPSSYRHYAVNFSKSGKTDLLNDEVDVIGSIANYYCKHGWTPHAPIAERALTIGHRYTYLSKKIKIPQPISLLELTRYGVVPKNKISQDSLKAKVIELQSYYKKEYWLGFHNFDVIKRYNSSDLYAMAIYQLSQNIDELRKENPHGYHAN